MEETKKSLIDVVKEASRNGTLFNVVNNGVYNHSYTRKRGLFINKEGSIPPQIHGYSMGSVLNREDNTVDFLLKPLSEAKKPDPIPVALTLPRDTIIGRWSDSVSWLSVGTVFMPDGTFCDFPGYNTIWDDREYETLGVNAVGETKEEFLRRYRSPIFGGEIVFDLLAALGYNRRLPKFINGSPIISGFGLLPVSLRYNHVILENPLETTHLLLFSIANRGIDQLPVAKPFKLDLGNAFFAYGIPITYAAPMIGKSVEALRVEMLHNLYWFINNEANIARFMSKNEIGKRIRSEEVYVHTVEVTKRIQKALAEKPLGRLSQAFYEDFMHVLDRNLSDWTFRLPTISAKTYAVSRHNLVVLEKVAEILESYLDNPCKTGSDAENQAIMNIESKLDRLLIYELYSDISSHTGKYLET